MNLYRIVRMPGFIILLTASLLAACSPGETNKVSRAGPDQTIVARKRLAQLKPELADLIDQSLVLSHGIAPSLTDELSERAVSEANSRAMVQQASYEANLENYGATASGVEAGMRAQNAIKETRIAGLRKAIALKKAALPVLTGLSQWERIAAVARARGRSVSLDVELGAARNWLRADDLALTRIGKLSGRASVRGRQASAIALNQRWERDRDTYASLAGVLGLPTAALPGGAARAKSPAGPN